MAKKRQLISAKKLLEHKTVKRPQDIIDAAEKLNLEDWQKIPNIGPKIAESIFEYFKNKNHIAFLKKLDKAGVKIISPKITAFPEIKRQEICFNRRP